MLKTAINPPDNCRLISGYFGQTGADGRQSRPNPAGAIFSLTERNSGRQGRRGERGKDRLVTGWITQVVKERSVCRNIRTHVLNSLL